VLTSAFDEGVAAVIGRKMGVGEIVPPADWMAKGYDLTVLGSPIDYEDSLANSVDLYYYNGTEKGAGICTVLGHMDAPQPRREEIVYMGNDERDEPVIGDVGRFVVAPMAADDFKQHMAGKYGSKVRVPERWEVYMALTSD
jgi:hypothetical protein